MAGISAQQNTHLSIQDELNGEPPNRPIIFILKKQTDALNNDARPKTNFCHQDIASAVSFGRGRVEASRSGRGRVEAWPWVRRGVAVGTS
jgi:hypothetical protein